VIQIREITGADEDAILRLYEKSGLPVNCLPDMNDPLFIIKKAVEHDSQIVEAGFLRLTGELYLLVDHKRSTPATRWEMLQRLCAEGLKRAAELGLTDVSCWVPPDLEKSFGKRLEDLGFKRSAWTCFTAKLE
jgi:hypothetical protein